MLITSTRQSDCATNSTRRLDWFRPAWQWRLQRQQWSSSNKDTSSKRNNRSNKLHTNETFDVEKEASRQYYALCKESFQEKQKLFKNLQKKLSFRDEYDIHCTCVLHIRLPPHADRIQVRYSAAHSACIKTCAQFRQRGSQTSSRTHTKRRLASGKSSLKGALRSAPILRLSVAPKTQDYMKLLVAHLADVPQFKTAAHQKTNGML